jgi:hypothetical protein
VTNVIRGRWNKASLRGLSIRRRLRSARHAAAPARERVELLTGIAYLLAVLAYPMAQHGTLDPCAAVAERAVLMPMREDGGLGGRLAAGTLGDWLVPELARARLGSAGCFRVLWAEALEAATPPSSAQPHR